jgi:hypothetical protein
MHFGSSTQFVIKIKQNHMISSMNNYIQFRSNTQFVINQVESYNFKHEQLHAIQFQCIVCY